MIWPKYVIFVEMLYFELWAVVKKWAERKFSSFFVYRGKPWQVKAGELILPRKQK